MTYESILNFWFAPEHEEKWFVRDDAFDHQIQQHFAEQWLAASKGELYAWRTTLRGRLAEIIILDQFSRNLNRGSAVAWAQDGMALVLSQEALCHEDAEPLTDKETLFMLMPWMHAESLVIHDKAAELFAALDDANALRSAREHRDIIQRFGRYPHRNALLGRPSTPEEEQFLREKTLSFY